MSSALAVPVMFSTAVKLSVTAPLVFPTPSTATIVDPGGGDEAVPKGVRARPPVDRVRAQPGEEGVGAVAAGERVVGARRGERGLATQDVRPVAAGEVVGQQAADQPVVGVVAGDRVGLVGRARDPFDVGDRLGEPSAVIGDDARRQIDLNGLVGPGVVGAVVVTGAAVERVDS